MAAGVRARMVREPQHHDGGQYEEPQGAQHEHERPVAALEGGGHPPTRPQQAADARGGRWPPKLGRIDVCPTQLGRRTEHGHPIARRDGVVASGAQRHVRSVAGDDGDGGQVAEATAKGGVGARRRPDVGLHLELHHREQHAVEVERMRWAAHAGLDERRRGERGHVQDALFVGDPAQRLADRGVGQLGDHPDPGA